MDFHEYKELLISGCSSSGDSDFCAFLDVPVGFEISIIDDNESRILEEFPVASTTALASDAPKKKRGTPEKHTAKDGLHQAIEVECSSSSLVDDSLPANEDGKRKRGRPRNKHSDEENEEMAEVKRKRVERSRTRRRIATT